jgi:hypothetical protein
MGCAGRVGWYRNAHRALVGNRRERENLEDTGVAERVILQYFKR